MLHLVTLFKSFRRFMWLFCAASLWPTSVLALSVLQEPHAAQQDAVNPSVGTDSQNPFLKKVFITARQTDQSTGYENMSGTRIMGDVFRFFAFNTDEGVTVGRCVFRIYLDNSIKFPEISFPVAAVNSQNETYRVDPDKRSIRIGKESYEYVVRGKVITLKTLVDSFEIYEVPLPFFLTESRSAFWALDISQTPSEPSRELLENLQVRVVQNLRAYVDDVIRKAKATHVTEILFEPPPPPPPPTNTNVTQLTQHNNDQTIVVDQESGQENNDKTSTPPASADLVDGRYQGGLVDTGDGSQWKLSMRVESLSQPSGQPAIAAIKATMKFEGVETEEILIGTAAYDAETELILMGKSPRGTVMLQGRLKGNQLIGTWNSKGADGKLTEGTLQAVRTGP